MARPLDHLILPVTSLEAARERYTSLGFTVAPDAQHPFGTENCCVFFENNSYLEPLAVNVREDVEENARLGMEFLRHHLAYTFRNGLDGFSMMAFRSMDGKADEALFAEEGFGGAELFQFRREAVQEDGTTKTLGIVGAFAKDGRSPDFTAFTLERLGHTAITDMVMEAPAHKNGALGISDVILVENNPSDFQYYLQTLTDQREMENSSFGIFFDLPNTRLSVLTPEGAARYFGIETIPAVRGPLAKGFVIEVSSLEQAKKVLTSNGIEAFEHAGMVGVSPTEGQGATILFKEVNK